LTECKQIPLTFQTAVKRKKIYFDLFEKIVDTGEYDDGINCIKAKDSRFRENVKLDVRVTASSDDRES